MTNSKGIWQWQARLQSTRCFLQGQHTFHAIWKTVPALSPMANKVFCQPQTWWCGVQILKSTHFCNIRHDLWEQNKAIHSKAIRTVKWAQSSPRYYCLHTILIWWLWETETNSTSSLLTRGVLQNRRPQLLLALVFLKVSFIWKWKEMLFPEFK